MSTNWDDYNEFLKDADKDNRVGDHEAAITSITDDTWPSGDPRKKVMFSLTTANNALADLTISDLPDPETLKAESANYDHSKKRGIASGITIRKQLEQHYGKSADDLAEGDKFKVKTAKTRVDAEGKGGFIRVIAFLPKDHATNGNKSNVPF